MNGGTMRCGLGTVIGPVKGPHFLVINIRT